MEHPAYSILADIPNEFVKPFSYNNSIGETSINMLNNITAITLIQLNILSFSFLL